MFKDDIIKSHASDHVTCKILENMLRDHYRNVKNKVVFFKVKSDMSVTDLWKEAYYKKVISYANLLDYLVMFQVESYKKAKLIKKINNKKVYLFDEKVDISRFSLADIKLLNHYM